MPTLADNSTSLNQPNRCGWCGDDLIYQAYHDTEWGKPCYDERTLFAMLCLEGMQAGLSWITILKRREGYYHAFDEFDAQKIASFNDNKVALLMQDTGIIRHELKIRAIINNAKAYLAITKQQSFADYLWGITTDDGKPIINHPINLDQVPVSTPVSDRLAKQLKKDGFKFVGSTTCYAYMQAVGMVNDHLMTCDFR
ncbi:MAG: DNA-3-methyladenine glycosylase I [Moraxella sp.]|nr:DNA-3-methyladenine glycosylase I [Moraxella sp.]